MIANRFGGIERNLVGCAKGSDLALVGDKEMYLVIHLRTDRPPVAFLARPASDMTNSLFK
jgi:hypothetical protein